VEVLTEAGQAIPDFAREDCVALQGDATARSVAWKLTSDLSQHAGQKLRFRFYLSRGQLYSFWVSSDASGMSGGYVAAGGPGYNGSRDERTGVTRAGLKENSEK
jgi:hypothetical protein